MSDQECPITDWNVGKEKGCTTTPFPVSASTLRLKISRCVSCFIFFVKFPRRASHKGIFVCVMMFWFRGSVILRWVSELTYCLADEIIFVEACFGVRVDWGIVELAEVRGYSICDRQGRVFLPWCQVRGWHCSCLFRCYQGWFSLALWRRRCRSRGMLFFFSFFLSLDLLILFYLNFVLRNS